MTLDYRELMHKLVTLSVLHRYYIHQNASAAGLYAGQPPVLEYLKQHGTVVQKQIADALHVSAASVAVSIRRMEKNGLVSRETDSADMRCNRVGITPAGLRALDDFDAVCHELDSRLFSGISQEELQCFDKILGRMTANLLEGRDESEIINAFAFARSKPTSEMKGEKDA